MGRVWFRGRLACPPPFLVPACGVGVCAGPGSRLCPALLGWVVGGCFMRCCIFFFLSRALWSLSLHPLSFGLGWWFFLLFFVSVSSSPVGRCSWLGVAGFEWVVPLCLFGGPVFGAFWGGVRPPLVVLAGGLAAVGCFRAFSPSPPPFCFFGGGACLFLPLPSLGWRTHWPAFSVVFRAAVFSCVLFGHLPAPWVGWAMYTVGSAPLLAGLGPGSAGWAAAPGGCLWFWVRGLGLFVSFPLCAAGCGPPLLSPGALWPRVWPAVLVCGGLGVPLGLVGRVGRSRDGPWGCPLWGPVPWSRVLWGFRSLVLGAAAVPLSSSGACEVALVVAGFVAWR